MRQSTPQEEKQATNSTEKSGRGETPASMTVLSHVRAAQTRSGLKTDMSSSKNSECSLQLNAVCP